MARQTRHGGTIAAVLAAVVIAGCASPPSAPDLAACRTEVAGRGGADSMRRRVAAIDDCMRARGWRPAPGCVETALEGTAFCDYVR